MIELQQCQHLNSLTLTNSQLNASGIIHVLDFLESRQFPIFLDISHNQLQQEGLTYLNQFLQSQKAGKLHSLNLTNTGLNKIILRNICESLQTNSRQIHLKQLIIDQNQITDHSFSQLLQALKFNPHILLLSASHCCLTSYCIQDIKDFLEQNMSLKFFILDGNKFEEETQNKILLSLLNVNNKISTRLLSVSLIGCFNSYKTEEEFKQLALLNQKSKDQFGNKLVQIFIYSGDKGLYQQQLQDEIIEGQRSYDSFQNTSISNLKNNTHFHEQKYIASPQNNMSKPIQQNISSQMSIEQNPSSQYINLPQQDNQFKQLSRQYTPSQISPQKKQSIYADVSIVQQQFNPKIQNQSPISIQTRQYNYSPKSNAIQQDAIIKTRVGSTKSKGGYIQPIRDSQVLNVQIRDMSIDEINEHIDKNSNDIIKLFEQREQFLEAKRNFLQQKYIEKLNLPKIQTQEQQLTEIQDLRMKIGDSTIQDLIQKNEYFKKCPTFMNMMVKESQRPGSSEMDRISKSLQDFWIFNKEYENSIEMGLKILNELDEKVLYFTINIYIDIKLENITVEISVLCSNLDQAEDKVKELLSFKDPEYIARAEPVYQQKQQVIVIIINYALNIKILESLEQIIIERTQIQDEKLQKIREIVSLLAKLKDLRVERINLQHNLYDDSENDNFNQRLFYLTQAQEQVDNVQLHYFQLILLKYQLIQLKKNFNNYIEEERQLADNLRAKQLEMEKIYNSYLQTHNEEAQLFKNLTENLSLRVNINRIIEYLSQNGNIPQKSLEELIQLYQTYTYFQINLQFIISVQSKTSFFKQFVDEDFKIVDGLKKTNETISSLEQIIEQILIDKERRQDLIKNLISLAEIKQQENLQSEQLRKVDVEITKKIRQKGHIEEDLEFMQNEADLETFKKIGQVLQIHQNSLNQLNEEKSILIKEIDIKNQHIYGIMTNLKEQYEDVLKTIFPGEWTKRFDLRRLQDASYLKLTINKACKRMGLKNALIDESNINH